MPKNPSHSRSAAFRRRLYARGEDGQSLVIIVCAMFVIMVVAAFAIDLSSWYQKHHQEQVAADAAALAAANCLANQSSTNAGGNTCTSATDTTDAGGVATSIATTNKASTVSASWVTTTAGTASAVKNVTVTTSAPASSFFTRLIGLSPNASATAVASVYTNAKDCSTSSAGCLMFYAAASNCNSASITIQVGNSVNLNGGVLTNGPINDGLGNGGNWAGYMSYGQGSACATNTSFKNTGTFAHAPAQQATDYGSSSSPNWPINYATTFPACSGSGTAPTNCTSTATTNGVAGTPNYCTYASTSAMTTSQGNGVYCDVGSGTASNPATWNGAITGGTSTSVTVIGGTFTFNGQVLTAYSNNLLAYVTSTSSSAFAANGGNTSWTGDVFAPNGGAAVSNGNIGFTGFIQAQTINYQGGASTGDGPTYAGGSGNFSGSDSLTG